MSTLAGCTCVLFEAPEVPFIGPRGLGAVESNPGTQFLPSVGWRTRQFGAPPDTVRCPISFQNWRSRPLQSWSRWGTRHITVDPGHSRGRIARSTVGPADRWLTGQPGAPPDSPVNYSRTSPDFSRERPVHQSSAWRTGQCPMHHRTVRCARLSWVLAVHSQAFFISFLFFFSLFLTFRQIR
jgi:hypothetical protein